MLSGFLVMVTTILPEMAVMVFFILFVATIVVTLFVGTMSLSFYGSFVSDVPNAITQASSGFDFAGYWHI